MSAGLAYIIIFGSIFLATLLMVMGVATAMRKRAETVGRVNKRARTLLASRDPSDVGAVLRRDPAATAIAFVPQRFVTYLEGLLIQGGMNLSVQRLLLIMAGATLVTITVFPIVAGIVAEIHLTAFVMLLVVAVSIGVGGPILYISRQAAARTKTLQAQFPIALDVFVRGLRAGHPITSALELLVSEMPDPIRTEFREVIGEMNYGYDLRGALENLSKRVPTQDIQMFVVSVAIQSETGGNLADILDGLAKVIRDRASMVLKVRALASEGKMTATILTVLPVATFCFIFLTQPKFFLDVVDDPAFVPGTSMIVLWYGLGVFMMSRMIRIRV